LGAVGDAQSEQRAFVRCLGALWENGVPYSAPAIYHHEVRHKVALPARPLERQSYWLEPAVDSTDAVAQQRSVTPAVNAHLPPGGVLPSTSVQAVAPHFQHPIQPNATPPVSAVTHSVESEVTMSTPRNALMNEVRQLLEDASGL